MQTEGFVDGTIATLKVIGMVGKGGRLCVRKGQLCLENDDSVQFFRRWLLGDSRDITLMHVKNTALNAMELARNNHDPEMRGRVCRELHNCLAGLQNLRSTYIKDSVMVAHLEVLSDRVAFELAHLTGANMHHYSSQQQQQQRQEDQEVSEPDFA
jgi:hypothetical protein